MTKWKFPLDFFVRFLSDLYSLFCSCDKLKRIIVNETGSDFDFWILTVLELQLGTLESVEH